MELYFTYQSSLRSLNIKTKNNLLFDPLIYGQRLTRPHPYGQVRKKYKIFTPHCLKIVYFSNGKSMSDESSGRLRSSPKVTLLGAISSIRRVIGTNSYRVDSYFLQLTYNAYLT